MRRLWRRIRHTPADCHRWWCLRGQFSRPVRAVWPSRRRIHAEVRAVTSVPGYHEAALKRIERAVRRRRAQEFILTPEGGEHLLREIFGGEAEQIIRGCE
ncbi:hypothetical protein GCM10009544_07830 [Streptomyces stramineus]|uniref:Uncharacterized protein n=1 Tax=Streptomyces stramineus TaxID=173861 RepID=A0ABN0ZH10_9ACTN